MNKQTKQQASREIKVNILHFLDHIIDGIAV